MSAYQHPDVSATPQGPSTSVDPPEGATTVIPINEVTLVELVENERFYVLDKHESYLHAAQDMAKMYDWDGKIVSDGNSPIDPGWVVPMASRKPCARYDLSKVIVSRYTALLFGTDRFPELLVPGDADTEEYIKGLLEATRLPLRMIEARNVGGGQGSVGMSFAFVDGRPKLEVHKGKHCCILDWRDRSELRPSAVIKAYKYPRRVFDPESGKLKLVDFFYARMWTETDETVWEPIPFSVANTKAWSTGPKTVVQHGFGFCPFYWTQNLPNDEDEDGFSDYAGQLANLDEMNRLMSAGVRAVKANSDPTFVVKEDPSLKTEHIRKGQGEAIFSRNGAEYVVLPPHTIEAITKTKEDLRHATLDVASVVAASAEELSGAAQSAAALRILYAPMTAQAEIYREQYGEMLVKPIVRGMLDAARILTKRGIVVILPKRVVPIEGTGKVQILDRMLGDSEEIVLNWNPFFSPTWMDIKAAAEAVKSANGDKPVLSQRSSIAAVANLFGVESPDNEMAAIREDSAHALEQAQKQMAATFGGGPAPEGENKKPPFGQPAADNTTDEDEEATPTPDGQNEG